MIYEVEAGDTLIHLKGQWESSTISHASSTLYFISDSVLVSNLKDLTDDQQNEGNILSGDQVKHVNLLILAYNDEAFKFGVWNKNIVYTHVCEENWYLFCHKKIQNVSDSSSTFN